MNVENSFQKCFILWFSVSVYLLWVIFLRIYHHTLSIGFRSGEYAGRKTNSNRSLFLFKNGFKYFAWWHLTLSSIMITFLSSNWCITFIKKDLNVRALPLSALFTTTCPVWGATHPKNVCRSLLLCLVFIIGCRPLISHL